MPAAREDTDSWRAAATAAPAPATTILLPTRRVTFTTSPSRATDVGPAQTMATPVKNKLQQVFEEYSRPRRPFAEVREGDTTTTAEEDTTEEEGSSQY